MSASPINPNTHKCLTCIGAKFFLSTGDLTEGKTRLDFLAPVRTQSELLDQKEIHKTRYLYLTTVFVAPQPSTSCSSSPLVGGDKDPATALGHGEVGWWNLGQRCERKLDTSGLALVAAERGRDSCCRRGGVGWRLGHGLTPGLPVKRDRLSALGQRGREVVEIEHCRRRRGRQSDLSMSNVGSYFHFFVVDLSMGSFDKYDMQIFIGDEAETAHLRSLPSPSNCLCLFQIDLLDPDSILAAIRDVSGLFHLASPCIITCVQDPQRELLDPAVTGTLNVLRATKESGVRWVVITSLTSTIVPSPGWPADRVKNESCWTDLDYCR
ncbi:hypothetical protein ZIOFF_013806 [Zingiber officinale]|uniref:3-beta hydroxysteroid dehydrogenase/isomerase domain-containing protein n=1 Tax=Zingiber officinale TaxID=94328 RepID=A0A8J5LD51_ZINOF|nr:hypothetical protein ZIOFF_013806 [Zingiber officinale]